MTPTFGPIDPRDAAYERWREEQQPQLPGPGY